MSQTPQNFPMEEFSTEHDLNTSEQQAFWQTVIQDTLNTPDGLTLAYMMVKHPKAHAS
ncbi:MAG: alpha/beta fold hydrolase, partial [Shewanella sp.]